MYTIIRFNDSSYQLLYRTKLNLEEAEIQRIKEQYQVSTVLKDPNTGEFLFVDEIKIANYTEI